MELNQSTFKLKVEDLIYEFSADGFIQQIYLIDFDGVELPMIKNDFGRIHIKMSDGRVLKPFVRENTMPERGKFQEAEVVEFGEILWKDESENEIKGFRLALRYELWPGGRAFTTAFFCSNCIHSPDMDEFALKFDLAMSEFKDVRWSIRPRPKSFDGAVIQELNFARYLPRHESRDIPNEIICNVGFNARKADGQSAYFEINVDGQNSISEDPQDNYTNLRWTEQGDFTAEYGFIQNKPCKNVPMHYWQWRNQWSWVLKFADHARQKPPLHMYHYLDNFQKYPTNECLDQIQKIGADLLILHENWRFDIQDDGIPADSAALKRVITEAHKRNIRIALYIRGDECSAVESACEWFSRYLQKDYDGFYMDYGGPFHPAAPTESFPGGRIEFRRYFLRMKALRDRIGKEGVFYAHSGTSFSAIGYVGDLMDGYVSGEGEGGVMVNSREQHEYYSMAPVCPGTMWTGAFPAYSTAKMRPFLAAAGQYPHSPLGVQFESSSLAHPQEPGLNDNAFKPIWKLWHFFRNERNMRIYNDYNSVGVFSANENAGHYMMSSADGKKALMIVCNFSDQVNRFTTQLNFSKVNLQTANVHAWKLVPTENDPGKAEKISAQASSFDFELGPYDVAGIYFDTDPADAQKYLDEFEMPYPEYSASNREHLIYLKEQTQLRYEPIPRKEVYIQAAVPTTDQPYEFSLLYDLYLNAMAVVEFMADGSEKILGWISKNGFVADRPEPEDYIWPDEKSPWIPLHQILEPGEHFLGIKSIHYNVPFYSFLTLDIADNPEGKEASRLCFMNELEPNREYLRWKVILN